MPGIWNRTLRRIRDSRDHKRARRKARFLAARIERIPIAANTPWRLREELFNQRVSDPTGKLLSQSSPYGRGLPVRCRRQVTLVPFNRLMLGQLRSAISDHQIRRRFARIKLTVAKRAWSHRARHEFATVVRVFERCRYQYDFAHTGMRRTTEKNSVD